MSDAEQGARAGERDAAAVEQAITEQAAEQNRRLVESMPHAAALGIRIDAATPTEVIGRLAWRPDLTTLGGALHGGVLMALADSLGAVCAFLNLPDGATGTSTIESKTNFFRGVGGGEVHATTRPLHVGRTTVVVQTDLFDDGGRRVAQVTQTQSVLYPRG
jgi:1,4-dihydroxy-2-naphthoyl-CoA hydrolase